ncbi:MAG: TIGR02147 family protein [Fibrobacterales bacterium]
MNIFGYYNYRTYLKDFYEQRKSVNTSFSYRVFTKEAGLNSPSVYVDILKGRRNMTLPLLEQFSVGLQLDEREKKYFQNMMRFTNAKTAEAKQESFEDMSQMLPSNTRKLTMDQRRYFEKWYHLAVRESLAILNIDTNYEKIAWFLSPKVSLAKIKQTMELLIDLDLIEMVDGYWRSKNKVVQGDHIDPFTIHNTQKQFIELSKECLDHFSKEKRNISNITLSTSQMGVERINRKIDMFRNELLEMVQSDSEENQIYQFNVQFFPLSKECE